MKKTTAAARVSLNTEINLSFQFLAVNLLNLGDFMLTKVALARGGMEANPFVRAISLPGKLVLVLAASVLIEVLHPKRLWWAIPPLLAVVIYSSVNLLFT